MATLHGSWIIQGESVGYLWIWAEAWRDLSETSESEAESEIRPHPFNLDKESLRACLKELTGKIPPDFDSLWQTEIITLPSQTVKKVIYPLLSGQDSRELKPTSLSLHPWQVQGIRLDAFATGEFFKNVSLSLDKKSLFGNDLQFFSHLYRWSLDLIVRRKFLPGIQVTPSGNQACWYPLIDSTLDQTRLAKFSQLMPPVCLSYGQLSEQKDDPDFPLLAQKIILSFLQAMVNAQIITKSPALNLSKETPLQIWLESLTNLKTLITGENNQVQKIVSVLNNWQLPIQDYLVSPDNQQLGKHQFRVCFVLEPPNQDEIVAGNTNWRLNYVLQALDNASFWVNADTIWQQKEEQLIWENRVIEQPQETLLKGLGLASRLYAPIAASLEESQPSYCILDSIQVYEFIKASAWQLEDNGLGVIVPPSLASGGETKRLGLQIQGQVTPKKGERLSLNSLVQYNLQLIIGDHVISEKDFKQLLDQKSPLVEINGEWITLQPADVRAAQSILNKSNEPLSLSVEDALRISIGENQILAKLPVVNFEASGILQEFIHNITDNQAIQPIENPSGFKGTLRPYQARGVGWLAFLEKWGLGSCLADDMGLGKTPQLLAFMLHLKSESMLSKPVLIACPTSVINNWEHEIKKFAPSLSIHIHHGDKRSKGTDFAKIIQHKNLILTSYALLYRDSKTLERIDWQGIVLDEAQNIKNPQSKQAQAVRQLKAGFRIALTGTPVENRLSELWAILDFLNPNFLGTQAFFQKRFATPIEKFGDRQSLQVLRSLVRPFILRRLKTDTSIIQDLPEKQEMTVFCGLSLEQANLYEALVEQSLAKIEDSKGIQRQGLVLGLLVKLKQICNHPSQYLKEKLLENAALSGKLLRLQEMLEEVIDQGDRALIFTQFAEWGHLLKPYLNKHFNQEVLFLHGGTSRQARQVMIDRFQNDPDAPNIFILSLKAGGTGLNLTRANHVFHIDRWWNPAVENQATDRAFRIGQKRNVQVHKFVCTGTLEEKINDMIESKKQLADQTVDAGENWLTELDTDQLRNLLLLDRNTIIGE
jgi:SNF2 family DNA or RNA helicase